MFTNAATKCILAAGLALTVFVPAASAKKVKPEQVLYDFCSKANCSDGEYPKSGLIMDSSGNLYGTTNSGGGNVNDAQCPAGCGEVFKLAPDGTETVLYNFCSQAECSDGAGPYAGLIMDGSGNFYGTTVLGGIYDCEHVWVSCGTVFRLAPDGTETTLYSFCPGQTCTDGFSPTGGVIMDRTGNLYGTTSAGGGSGCNGNGCGTVFKVAPDGTETTLYTFCSQANCSDGGQPYAGLHMDGSGNLYGTTSTGGSANGGGTLFEVAPSGTMTVLYSFCSQANCSDGSSSWAGLIADANGDLYGTTTGGGADRQGTVFMLAPNGTETVLHSFAGGSDGTTPFAGLLLDSAGNLYGTTYGGGSTGCKDTGCGTAFKLAPDGSQTVLYAFKKYKYGLNPESSLIADSHGNLYGTAQAGGLSKKGPLGVVFKVNVNAGTKR